jgi:hypothetical protein
MKLHHGRELTPYRCPNGRLRVVLHDAGHRRHARYVDDLVVQMRVFTAGSDVVQFPSPLVRPRQGVVDGLPYVTANHAPSHARSQIEHGSRLRLQSSRNCQRIRR